MSNPSARVALSWSHLLVILALLAASLLADATPVEAASMKAPSGLKATAKTSTTLTMKWKGVSRAPRYQLRYSTSSQMDHSSYQLDGHSTGKLTGLKPGKTYYVKVRVISKSGGSLSDYSKAVKVTTLAKAPVPTPTPAPTSPAPVPTMSPTPFPTPFPTSSPTPFPTSSPTPAPTTSTPPAPSVSPVPTPSSDAPRLNLPAEPTVLLVGDSYTEGVGADPMTNGYAYKIADPLGWTLTRDGKGGSGYVNPTSYGAGIFADRLYRHPVDGYDLVVLQGSSNDVKYDAAQLDGNLNMTLQIVRERYPHAQVLMVGPTNPYGKPWPDLVRVNDEVKAAAGSWGAAFIDPIAEQWFVPGDGKWAANPANGHPSNAGHQAIADRFVADVRTLS